MVSQSYALAALAFGSRASTLLCGRHRFRRRRCAFVCFESLGEESIGSSLSGEQVDDEGDHCVGIAWPGQVGEGADAPGAGRALVLW